MLRPSSFSQSDRFRQPPSTLNNPANPALPRPPIPLDSPPPPYNFPHVAPHSPIKELSMRLTRAFYAVRTRVASAARA